MNRIIGVDPSLTGTGIATLDGTHTISSKPTNNTLGERHRRLSDIRYAIQTVALDLPRNTSKANLVVIEAPAFSRNNAGTWDRAGLWWLIVDRLHALGIPVIDVPPTTLKKFATGKGNATKPDMRMALYQRAGIDNSDDNQVDAWWLRAIGHQLVGDPIVDMPKANVDALAKVELPNEVAA